VVARTACVTMMPTGSYLDSTIRPWENAKEDSHKTEGTRHNDISSVQGNVVPTEGDVREALRRELEKMQIEEANIAKMQTETSGYTVDPDSIDPDVKQRALRVLGPVGIAAGAVAGTLAFTSVTTPKPITMDEVVAVQKAWGDAIVRISSTCLAGGECVDAAKKAADELYGYGRTDVLFKPTKASKNPFRSTGEGALSYFVGGDKIAGGFAEDGGFALNYGAGWKKVIFDNNQIDFNGATAQAMGEYYFYSAADDSVSKVEYTFGYKRNNDGKVRIYLHHSSLPYQKKPKVLAPITMDELTATQKAWGNAILRISKVYLAGGDYVDEAAKAADELYGYGRTSVLFKPTKASEYPFRPTGTEALSYFVGGDKVTGGYAEDKGFALGPGGVGWKNVIFDNNQIDFNGATAQAMGEYYFFSAKDDSVSKVEYTFGYKRNDDGKVRIYLHHSSLPYPGSKKA